MDISHYPKTLTYYSLDSISKAFVDLNRDCGYDSIWFSERDQRRICKTCSLEHLETEAHGRESYLFPLIEALFPQLAKLRTIHNGWIHVMIR